MCAKRICAYYLKSLTEKLLVFYMTLIRRISKLKLWILKSFVFMISTNMDVIIRWISRKRRKIQVTVYLGVGRIGKAVLYCNAASQNIRPSA
jgi:hypothetical protein